MYHIFKVSEKVSYIYTFSRHNSTMFVLDNHLYLSSYHNTMLEILFHLLKSRKFNQTFFKLLGILAAIYTLAFAQD